jgi:hypothetical protein
MSDIRAALAQIYRRQDEIAITSVVFGSDTLSRGVEKVWPIMPPQRVTITDTPCFVNLVPESETEFFPSLTRSKFTVNMRLVVHDANIDRACDIALAFYPEIVSKFRANIGLGLAKWSIGALRTEGEFLRLFEEYTDAGGKAYVGLDLFLDLNWNGGGNNAHGTVPPV